MTAPAQTLPSAGRRRAVTLLAALPWPAVLFEFLAILPGYDKLFRQFDRKLDGATALLLNVSAWVRQNVVLAFAVVFVLMATSMFVTNTVYTMPMRRIRRAAVLLFVFGLPSLLFALVWLGVLSTHRTLVEGLHK